VNEAHKSAELRALLYDAEGEDREIEPQPGLLDQISDQSLLWLDVGNREARVLGQTADVLAIDQSLLTALSASRPFQGVANFGEYLAYSVLTVPGDPREADGGRLDFVVGKNWLMTVHDREIAYLQAFRDQDCAETRTGALSGQAFAASLLDWHFEDYFNAVSAIESRIEQLDARILAKSAGREMLRDIVSVQHAIAALRRRLSAHRPVIYGLMRPDLAVQEGADRQQPYDRLGDRFERALDEVEHVRDLVIVSFDLLNSRLGQSTNDFVKALTFFTVVIGGVAAVAGLFGMNFDTPFFHTGQAGFFTVTGVLAMLALAGLIWARRSDWL
jgi:magnesium transporter